MIPLSFILLTGCSDKLVDLVKKTRPGVVFIVSEKNDLNVISETKNRFSNPGKDSKEPKHKIGSGTGFFIDKRIIVTNNHIIRNNKTLKIYINGNTSSFRAVVIATDKTADIAILMITDPAFDPAKITILKWGKSRKLEQGESIYTIGHPAGLSFTVTTGIISYDRRRLSSPYQEVIQTDASINPGNSGGPMFNMSGEVVGVNTFIYSKSGGSIGLNFAVSQYTAEDVVMQLLLYHKVQRVLMGIKFTVINNELVIKSMSKGSAAENSGLMPYDIIIKYHEHPFTTFDNFFDHINRLHRSGEVINLDIKRNGKMINIDVILAERTEADIGKNLPD